MIKSWNGAFSRIFVLIAVIAVEHYQQGILLAITFAIYELTEAVRGKK